MANLPPGPLYLSRLIAHSIPPTVVGYIVLRELVKHFDFAISNTLLVIAALFTRPTYAILSSVWCDWSNWLDARRKGAVIVQNVRDPWPGGLGVVAAMVKSFKSGYPGMTSHLHHPYQALTRVRADQGDVFLDWCKHYGNTYSLRVIAEHRVRTLIAQSELYLRGFGRYSLLNLNMSR